MSGLIGDRKRLRVDPDRRQGLPQHLKVLLAMAKGTNWTTARIPYEDIVIAAWREFPEAFSLRNHPEHPDGSDVHKRVYQNLKPAGFVASLGNKVFRLTEEGLTAARAIEQSLAGRESVAEDRGRLTRDQQAFVEHALAAPALNAWRAGKGDQLIDYDARQFFQFTTGTPVGERARRVHRSLRALEKASKLGIEGAEAALALGNELASRYETLWLEETKR